MEYNKLSPQPPSYSEAQSGWNVPPGAAATAPPNEIVQPAPMYIGVPTPTQVINVTSQSVPIMDNAGQGMICPYCNARVRMRVEHHATCSTYVWAALLCLFMCWPCVCLPCCCNCGYKTSQFCPNCKACLGSF